LCNKAKETLWPLLTQYQLSLQEIDIIDHPRLFEAFAVKIPVITFENIRQPIVSTHYLAWPFSMQEVDYWLSNIHS